MDAKELAKILRLHAMWRSGEPAGNRANLSRADLIGANLSGADLSKANLIGANLIGAKGLICLHVHHPAGYRPVAVEHDGGWRIFAGCRSFTVPEALAHWGSPSYHTPALAAAYVRAITEQLS